MPKKANFIFEVRIRISEAFTLDSIVRSPRTFKPKDVQSACQNNELSVTHGSPPPKVTSLATYVMTDFFAVLHATGLYNRQKAMWEALSKVNSIHVNQLSSGVFQKSALPIFDFAFLDYKGKPLLLANLVTAVPEKKKPVGLLKDFIGRASGRGAAGVLACFAAPVPAEVVDYVQKATFTVDPVLKYESIMPGVNKPFDLLEMNEANLISGSHDGPAASGAESGGDADFAGTELRTVFALLHPDLKKKAAIGALPSNVKMPRKKDAEAEADADAPAEGLVAEVAAEPASSDAPNTVQ
jgi:hypothetical protein